MDSFDCSQLLNVINKIPIVDDIETIEINDKTKNLTPCFINLTNNHIYTINIPDCCLSNLNYILIKSSKDLLKIPKTAGNYWILTNEPISHCFNSGNKYPESTIDNLNIVYNGVSGNLKSRAKEHLLRTDDNGKFGSMSGISIDVIEQELTNKSSHAKCLFGDNKKIPKIFIDGSFQKINDKNLLPNYMNLTDNEINLIQKNNILYFKNGIDVNDEKHIEFNWYFVFVEINNHSIRDYIETHWRTIYGVPILCSYSSGR